MTKTMSDELKKALLDAFKAGKTIMRSYKWAVDWTGQANTGWEECPNDGKGLWLNFNDFEYRIDEPVAIKPLLQSGQQEYLVPVPITSLGPGRHWWPATIKAREAPAAPAMTDAEMTTATERDEAEQERAHAAYLRGVADGKTAAPARPEDMAAFAAELKADPAKAQAFFQEAGILDASGNLTPQYGGQEQAQGYPLGAPRQQATPCGECHLQPGERCDVCGAIAGART